MTDIRWHQRLENYSSALTHLTDAVNIAHSRPLSELEKQGLIQAFEFTHELAWNVLKDYFAFQGNVAITGSRDAAREAFSKGLITNGNVWMEMIQSRNKTSHTYNKKVSEEITQKILEQYFVEFQDLQKMLLTLKERS